MCELCRKHGKGEVSLSLDPSNQPSESNGKVCLSIFKSNVRNTGGFFEIFQSLFPWKLCHFTSEVCNLIILQVTIQDES